MYCIINSAKKRRKSNVCKCKRLVALTLHTEEFTYYISMNPDPNKYASFTCFAYRVLHSISVDLVRPRSSAMLSFTSRPSRVVPNIPVLTPEPTWIFIYSCFIKLNNIHQPKCLHHFHARFNFKNYCWTLDSKSNLLSYIYIVSYTTQLQYKVKNNHTQNVILSLEMYTM